MSFSTKNRNERCGVIDGVKDRSKNETQKSEIHSQVISRKSTLK